MSMVTCEEDARRKSNPLECSGIGVVIEHSDDSEAGGDTAEQEYEVVIGHRRVATARKADLETSCCPRARP